MSVQSELKLMILQKLKIIVKIYTYTIKDYENKKYV